MNIFSISLSLTHTHTHTLSLSFLSHKSYCLNRLVFFFSVCFLFPGVLHRVTRAYVTRIRCSTADAALFQEPGQESHRENNIAGGSAFVVKEISPVSKKNEHSTTYIPVTVSAANASTPSPHFLAWIPLWFFSCFLFAFLRTSNDDAYSSSALPPSFLLLSIISFTWKP